MSAFFSLLMLSITLISRVKLALCFKSELGHEVLALSMLSELIDWLSEIGHAFFFLFCLCQGGRQAILSFPVSFGVSLTV